jgi:hypothetical protein
VATAEDVRAAMREYGEAMMQSPPGSDDRFRGASLLGFLDQLDARTRALREAPMPYVESTRDIDEWLEAYSEWWHANASEEALGG